MQSKTNNQTAVTVFQCLVSTKTEKTFKPLGLSPAPTGPTVKAYCKSTSGTQPNFNFGRWDCINKSWHWLLFL